MSQSIIVYRNPIEQMLWEDPAFGQIIGLIAGIILVIVVGYLVWSMIIQPVVQKIRMWGKPKNKGLWL